MEYIEDKRNKNPKLKEWYDKIKKVKNIEIAFAVILLAIILLVYSGVTSAKNKTSDNKVENAITNESLENNLEGILEEINGAGKVKVMITYDGSVEYITANTTNSNSNISTDGSRTNTTSSTTTSPVIVNNSGSSGPIIIKEIEPDIKGVIVVAEGANNVQVRLELMRAVMVALNIGAENIEIFAMK